MTIPMTNIPSTLRSPLFYAQVDNSKANTAALPQRTLIVGQKLASGTTQAAVPIRCQGLADAKGLAGAGSMIAAMVAAYLANDPTGELWILPLSDDGSAVAATGSIGFSGPATKNGTLALYLAGTLLQVPVASGNTAAQIATAVAAAITAAPDLLVSAAVDGVITTQVNLTAKNKGAAGNDIQVVVNFLGAPGGEYLPAGVTATIVAMANGSVNPSLTTPLANLGEASYDFIVSAYTDTTSTGAITALLDSNTGRWSPTLKLYGHCLIAYRGSQGQAASYLASLNDPHLTVLPFSGSPAPNYLIAAAVLGAAAASLRNDPGQPLQYLSVKGVLAPPLGSRYLFAQREALLHEGGSTFDVSGGLITIKNLITTYQFDALGNPDDSYLQVETMFQLMYVLRQLQSAVTANFARVKLAADGTHLAPGSGVVTPSMIKAVLIAKYRAMEAAGDVQNSTDFAANLVVEQNATNPNRVDVLYPAHLVSQLRVFAALIQFRLQ